MPRRQLVLFCSNEQNFLYYRFKTVADNCAVINTELPASCNEWLQFAEKKYLDLICHNKLEINFGGQLFQNSSTVGKVNTAELNWVFRQTSADELQQLNIVNSEKVHCLPSKLLIMKFGDTWLNG